MDGEGPGCKGTSQKFVVSSEPRSPLASQRDGTCRWLSWTAVQEEESPAALRLEGPQVEVRILGHTGPSGRKPIGLPGSGSPERLLQVKPGHKRGMEHVGVDHHHGETVGRPGRPDQPLDRIGRLLTLDYDLYSLSRPRPTLVIRMRAGFSETRVAAPSATRALSASVRAR